MNISPLQKERLQYVPKLPGMLRSGIASISMLEGEETQSVADQEKIAALFPNTYGKKEITFEKGQNTSAAKKQVVGVILSGGQAPGGHNVVCGLYDALKATDPENELFGFKNGPSGLLDDDYLVFDDFPGAVIFGVVGDGHTFEPVNNTCSPDNPELQRLLTGEPLPLADEFIETEQGQFTLTKDYVPMVKALTQAFINRSVGRGKLSKVIIRATDAQTTGLIQNLQFLPEGLVEPMTFTSNYLQGNGVPDGLQMVFVNEHNKEEMYEKDYITVDYINHMEHNIEPNYIFSVIDQLVERSDTPTVIHLLDFLSRTTLTPQTDYEFIYKLFKISEQPELGLDYGELNADFFDKLRALNMQEKQLEVPKRELNKLINNSLQGEWSDFTDALRLVDLLRRQDEHLLSISDDSRQHVADVLFNRNHALDQFSRAGLSLDLATYIIADNNRIDSPEALFRSLDFSGDTACWTYFIEFYYQDCLNDKASMERALPVIMGYVADSSRLVPDSKDGLADKFFPMNQYASQLYRYIKSRPKEIDSDLAPRISVADKIKALGGTVQRLVMKARPEVFSRLVSASDGNRQVIAQLSPLLETYFSEGDIDERMTQLKEQILNLTTPVFNQMMPNGLMARYAAHCYQHPEAHRNQTTLHALLNADLKLESNTRRQMDTLLRMYDNDVRLDSIGIDEMLLAKRMGKDSEYQHRLFEKWLAKRPKVADIKRYVTEGTPLSVSSTMSLVKTAWKLGGLRREQLVLGIIDAAHWKKSDRMDFIDKVASPDLSDFLKKQFVWWRSLLRKVKPLIRKKPGGAVAAGSLVLLTALVVSCGQNGDDRSDVFADATPYNTLNKQFVSPPLRVVEVTSEQLIETGCITYEFDSQGRLTSQTNAEYKRSMLRVRGKKRRVEVIDTIKTSQYFTYDPETGHLLSHSTGDFPIQTEVDEQGNLTVERFVTDAPYTVSYEYDSEGRLSQRIQQPDKGETLTWTFRYDELRGNLSAFVISASSGTHTVFECDTLGNVLKRTSYNKRGRQTEQREFVYDFDEHGNWISKKELDKNGNGQVVSVRTITYPTVITTNQVAERQQVLQQVEMKKHDNYIESVRDRIDNFGYFASLGTNRVMIITAGVLAALIFLLVELGVTAIAFFKEELDVYYPTRFAFLGYPDSKTGMRRMWMYNLRPYAFMGSLFLTAFFSVVLCILVMFIVGLLLLGLMWAVRIIIWILVVGGGIAVAIGLLAVFFGDDESKGVGCFSVVLGGLLVGFNKPLFKFGENVVAWGENFFDRINMVHWTWDFFTYYWDVILLVIAVPFIIFLAFALLCILISLLFMAVEAVVTHYYGIRRPCPSCGNTKRFSYIINGIEHPVGLHPGIYGILHQSRYVKKYVKEEGLHLDKKGFCKRAYRVPTMLFNGKGELTRKCLEPSCLQIINKDNEAIVATDLHIGIIGHRSNGKSYLMYKGLGMLLEEQGTRAKQVDATSNTDIMENYSRVEDDSLAGTDRQNRYRAVQLLLEVKSRPYPYHLFFYDVAGEKFNAANKVDDNAMDFYRNVQTIIFVIDPAMADTTSLVLDGRFEEWTTQHPSDETYNVDDAFAMLMDYLNTVGRKGQKVDLIFTFTKSDTGYFEAMGLDSQALSEEQIQEFMLQGMGLDNLINNARANFRSVGFAAVTAKGKNPQTLKDFFRRILKQRGVALE